MANPDYCGLEIGEKVPVDLTKRSFSALKRGCAGKMLMVMGESLAWDWLIMILGAAADF
jgi:hypothetical protein